MGTIVVVAGVQQPAAGTSTSQLVVDPPRPAGANGWTPANVVAVRSQNNDGFLESALHFALESVTERPGQRLSTQMIDEIAPHMAVTFGVDEQFVRQELARIYLYVGGPATSTDAAMTVGHHIFLPNAEQLGQILAPGYKRWLVHELAHTMQFLSYKGGNKYGFLASYIKAMAVGKDPQQPGSGSGPPVWGAAFTGWRTSHDGNESIGKASADAGQRLGFSLLPAAVIGVPLTLAAGAAIHSARDFARSRLLPDALQAANVLGRHNALLTGAAIIGAPLVVGSLSGVFADQVGTRPAQLIGTAAGAGVAGAALVAGGAFAGFGGGRWPLGATGGNLIAFGAIAAAGALGFVSATISANTISGWSRNADILHEHFHSSEEKPSLMDAVHDSHWEEIDAETVALRFGDRPDTIDTSAVTGKLPRQPGSLGDRLDWGVWNPLILGAPVAVAAGGAILGVRTAHNFFKDTVIKDKGLLRAVHNSFTNLQSKNRGVSNSMGVGAALTLTPLLVGGIAGPIADSLGIGADAAKLAGAGAASLVSGALLTMFLRGPGTSLLTMTPKVLGGMAIAAGVGYLSSSIAVNAIHPEERSYDIAGGEHARAAAVTTPVRAR